jgi:hypothetical protein
MMIWIRLHIRHIATVCAFAYVGGIVGAPATAFACEGAGEEKGSPPVLIFKAEKPPSGSGEACPGEFTVKGEKCIIRVKSKKKESINEAVRIETKPPALKVAFGILKQNCNGATLEPGVMGREECQVEIEFEKPAEPPEKRGKENVVVFHPASYPLAEFQVLPVAGQW